MKTLHFVIVLSIYTLSLSTNIVHGNPLYCPVIYKYARQPCKASNEKQCGNVGCCWDPNTDVKNEKCFEKDCRPGYFGYGCRYKCQCANDGNCDRYTGGCETECSERKWGVGCLLDEECTYNDKFAINYQGQKSVTENGQSCKPWTIQRAYPDAQFPEKNKTAASNFCRNPQPSDHKSWCYFNYGSSPKDRKWKYCSLKVCECPNGRWGINCVKECHCANGEEKCDQENGNCTSGCAEGWHGTDCQECTDGLFGGQCDKLCHCSNAQESCNKITGACVSGCAAGWTGINCQTGCNRGKFGKNCEFTCNCADDGEMCNNVDGQCDSGCKTGYTGSDCLIELPVLTRSPRIQSRGLQSILVKWDKWKKPTDRGDGPVDEYILKFKIKSTEEWETVRTSDFVYNITSIAVNKNYVIQVVPLRENVEGVGSPELEVATCGRPLSTVASMMLVSANTKPSRAPDVKESTGVVTNVEDSDNSYIIVSWRLPDADTLGCDHIVKYKIYTLGHKDKSFQFYGEINGTAKTRVAVSDVYSFANYTVGVSYINNAGFESEKAEETNIGRSGPVENLLVAPNTHSIGLSWKRPIAPNALIELYLLRRRQTTLADCDSLRKNWLPMLDIPSNFTSYTINELDPYSQYEVKLWARTRAGRGKQLIRKVQTVGLLPSGKVTEFANENVTSTTASFTWQKPLCNLRNGEFIGYSIKLSKILNPDIYIRNEIINTTGVELKELVPYENYMFVVSYVNHIGLGPSETIGFQTLESVPRVPHNLRIKLSLSDKLEVGWEEPNPPHGKITQYELKYWNNNIDMPFFENFTSEIDQFSLSGLNPNVSYRFQIRAYSSKGVGEWSSPISGFTEETYPSEPQNLRNVSRKTDELTLQWDKPFKPNGLLKEYKIHCKPKRAQDRYPPDSGPRFAPWDTTKYTVRDLQPGTEYICNVTASTVKGFGNASMKTFFTLPEEPATPKFPVLKKSETTDTTITLKIDPTPYFIKNFENSIVKHRIVVKRNVQNPNELYKKKRSAMQMPCDQEHQSLPDYYTALANNTPCYITAELPRQFKAIKFVIGDNKTVGKYYNAPLQKGQSYDLWFGVAVTVDGITEAAYKKLEHPVTAVFPVEQPKDAQIPVVAGIIAGALLVIVIIVVTVICLSRRRKDPSRHLEQATKTESEHLTASPRASSHHEKSSSADPYNGNTDSEGEADETNLYGEQSGTLRKPFDVEHLWNYVRDKKASKSNGFKQEYEEIPQNLRAPCDQARKLENRNLNRYGNIIAYDHSRVILKDCSEINTDYINANYIDAYHRPNAWIATQGPSKHTLDHIWHMVWQEKSHRIIMVTNLIEDGRHKCDQYWPETGNKTYGKITVEKLEEEQYADFTIRTFNMMKEGEDLRIVRQFHFTAWPDHGCPTYATSLIAFRKKVRSFHDPTSGPSVVHCSAGVGRTGTFIALDYLLDKAKNENIVDVYNTVHQMRSKRVNMVQTQEQYEFVYEALLEALKSGDTAIPCRDFRKRYLDLLKKNPETGKPRLAEEYELLSIMTPPVTNTGCKDAVDPENVPKNRNQDIIPLDNLARPYLMTYIPGSSDYINAVFSDGYKQRDAFIITQMPLPQTVVDLWAMCYDHECSAIVMMNELDPTDPTCACYYPVQAGSQVHGPFTIETVALDTNYPDITVRDVTLSYNKKGSEPRSVRQFQYHAWSKDQPLPLKRSSIIQLLQLIEKWQQRSGNKTIVVHCMDGATRSGLLCAITYMIERLKVEQEVDVFNSVKHTRINRPLLIPSLEQYKFIYEMAEEYMDCFETYANFK